MRVFVLATRKATIFIGISRRVLPIRERRVDCPPKYRQLFWKKLQRGESRIRRAYRRCTADHSRTRHLVPIAYRVKGNSHAPRDARRAATPKRPRLPIEVSRFPGRRRGSLIRRSVAFSPARSSRARSRSSRAPGRASIRPESRQGMTVAMYGETATGPTGENRDLVGGASTSFPPKMETPSARSGDQPRRASGSPTRPTRWTAARRWRRTRSLATPRTSTPTIVARARDRRAATCSALNTGKAFAQVGRSESAPAAAAARRVVGDLRRRRSSRTSPR